MNLIYRIKYLWKPGHFLYEIPKKEYHFPFKKNSNYTEQEATLNISGIVADLSYMKK